MIRRLLVIAAILLVCLRVHARVNEYQHFETYCQFAPAIFTLGASLVGIKSENDFTYHTILLSFDIFYISVGS